MTTIDWGKPIEAVHTNGRVTPVERFGGLNGHNVMPTLEGGWFAFEEDGTHNYPSCPWRIRNVPQQTPTPDVVGGEAAALTWIADRVRALRNSTDDWFDLTEIEQVARKALLPEPPDGDKAEAIRVMARYDIALDDDMIHSAVLDGIKRGRALERGEA